MAFRACTCYCSPAARRAVRKNSSTHSPSFGINRRNQPVKALSSIALSLSLVCSNFGQSKAERSSAETPKPSAQQPTTALKQPLTFGLEDGTPVKLRLTRNLSSADATTGDRVDFEVLEDVKEKDSMIIPRGGIAWGTVTEAQHKRRMARGGKLDVNIDDVRLSDCARSRK
jgi:hypothetical protein